MTSSVTTIDPPFTLSVSKLTRVTIAPPFPDPDPSDSEPSDDEGPGGFDPGESEGSESEEPEELEEPEEYESSESEDEPPHRLPLKLYDPWENREREILLTRIPAEAEKKGFAFAICSFASFFSFLAFLLVV